MAGEASSISEILELQRDGRLEDAVALSARLLAGRPDDPALLHVSGLLEAARGAYGRAADLFARAAAADPHNAVHLANLGTAFVALGRLDAAETVLRRAVALAPDQPGALATLGVLLHRRGSHGAALMCLDRARGLDPADPAVHINLGTVCTDMGDLDRAVEHLERAVALAPGDAEARWNLAVARLMEGDLARGWAAFEWRLRRPGLMPRRRTQALWDGGDPAGRTVLVHAEQGRGDTIQFVRFLPRLAERGARIILECQPELIRLLSRADLGVVEIVPPGATAAADLHCPLLSLPHRLGIGWGDLGAAVPYLTADGAAAAGWRGRLSDGRPLVGLAWAGNPANPVDVRRSLRPDELAPLTGLSERVRLVSLQAGGDPAALPAGLGMADPMGGVRDFADTADLIAALDLVVAVDTAVAHLAGALGRPVLLLNRFDGCWRWMKGRDDSPWYPTLRQIRQTTPGDWSGPLARVAVELARLSAGTAP